MSKPTVYMTQEMYDEKFIRVVPAPVTVPTKPNRTGLLLAAIGLLALAAVLVVYLIQG